MEKIKYPKTMHLPFSRSVTDDDRVLKNIDHFIGQHVTITEKYDGENSTMTNEFIHARSLDSNNHPSRNYVKGIWGNIKHLIPEGWRICGENMYAKHSIFYENLESYFLVFSIWDEKNVCLNVTKKDVITWK